MDDVTARTALDPVALTAAMRESAPLIDTLSIEVIDVGERVRLRLPDEVRSRNHVGGPHAGAIFTLGETAAACYMLVRLGHLLDCGVALAVSAEIAWLKLARCAVIAEATSVANVAEIEREFVAGGRPEWSTDICFIREDDGEVCGRMSVVLTLVRPRQTA